MHRLKVMCLSFSATFISPLTSLVYTVQTSNLGFNILGLEGKGWCIMWNVVVTHYNEPRSFLLYDGNIDHLCTLVIQTLESYAMTSRPGGFQGHLFYVYKYQLYKSCQVSVRIGLHVVGLGNLLTIKCWGHSCSHWLLSIADGQPIAVEVCYNWNCWCSGIQLRRSGEKETGTVRVGQKYFN